MVVGGRGLGVQVLVFVWVWKTLEAVYVHVPRCVKSKKYGKDQE